MTVSCRIGLVLAFLVALLSPASAGKKIVGLNFQPRHSSNVPCLFQPFFVAQQSDPFYKDLKEVKTKGRPEYRRGRNVVTNFPDTTIIWIHFWRGPAALGRCSALPFFDPAKIKFHVDWHDGFHSDPAQGRFVASEESSPETWCEDSCSGQRNYELRIDSQNVPLTDQLVIRIEAKTERRSPNTSESSAPPTRSSSHRNPFKQLISRPHLDPYWCSHKLKRVANLVLQKSLIRKMQLHLAVGEKNKRRRSDCGLRQIENPHSLTHRN